MSLALLLHSHQPVGNFDRVIEETYHHAYEPFLDVLAEHPAVRLSLHYSGHLLEWLEAHHPEFISKLRSLMERGQVELAGGGYYEPILAVIPDRDKHAQLAKLRDYIRDRFGVTPRGAWLAERVWEPTLARPLAEARVEYVLVDDTHFLYTGLEDGDLRGYYVTEEAGFSLRLIPSLKALRYAIPFREPEETLDLLQQGIRSAARSPLFAMGDDMEKFGGWPGTFERCYRDRWLERFFQALEQSGDWLRTTTLSEFLDGNPPLGRTYLPTASYEEMALWALPVGAARDLRACLTESGHLTGGGRFHRFLRGGFWRSFLVKYPESNQIHKLMLDVSRRLEAACAARATAGPPLKSECKLDELLARTRAELLASQCNDAYWHGVFGGLYTPHLRAGVQRHLIRAESALDRMEKARLPELRVRHLDFDCDGHREVLVDHPLFGLVLRPSDGGTVSSLRFKPVEADLINSLARREEAYHDDVRKAADAETVSTHAPESAASIHDIVRSKDPNLAAFLLYDRYPRHVFRTYAFPSSKGWHEHAALGLGESAELAGGGWSLAELRPEPWADRAAFELERASVLDAGGVRWRINASKSISTREKGTTWPLECRSRFSTARDAPVSAPEAQLAFGLELVFNLLAPDAPGRYFLASQGGRLEPLGFAGELLGPKLLLADEWQGVNISLEADPEPVWWIAPIYTVSQSEAGFEKVYQGSSILAVWKPKLSLEGGAFESRLTLAIESVPPRR